MTVWPVTTGQEFWSVSIKSLSHIHINKRTEHLYINNFIFILNGRCSVLMITDHGMECQCTVIPLNPKPFEQIESWIIKLEANKVSSKPQWKQQKMCPFGTPGWPFQHMTFSDRYHRSLVAHCAVFVHPLLKKPANRRRLANGWGTWTLLAYLLTPKLYVIFAFRRCTCTSQDVSKL